MFEIIHDPGHRNYPFNGQGDKRCERLLVVLTYALGEDPAIGDFIDGIEKVETLENLGMLSDKMIRDGDKEYRDLNQPDSSLFKQGKKSAYALFMKAQDKLRVILDGRKHVLVGLFSYARKQFDLAIKTKLLDIFEGPAIASHQDRPESGQIMHIPDDELPVYLSPFTDWILDEKRVWYLRTDNLFYLKVKIIYPLSLDSYLRKEKDELTSDIKISEVNFSIEADKVTLSVAVFEEKSPALVAFLKAVDLVNKEQEEKAQSSKRYEDACFNKFKEMTLAGLALEMKIRPSKNSQSLEKQGAFSNRHEYHLNKDRELTRRETGKRLGR